MANLNNIKQAKKLFADAQTIFDMIKDDLKPTDIAFQAAESLLDHHRHVVEEFGDAGPTVKIGDRIIGTISAANVNEQGFGFVTPLYYVDDNDDVTGTVENRDGIFFHHTTLPDELPSDLLKESMPVTVVVCKGTEGRIAAEIQERIDIVDESPGSNVVNLKTATGFQNN